MQQLFYISEWLNLVLLRKQKFHIYFNQDTFFRLTNTLLFFKESKKEHFFFILSIPRN